FHEPVLDEDGTVYMGSADTRFYAIDADGQKKWEFPTEQIIDSTALIAADSHIYLPAGDGYLYKLTPDGQEVWRVSADAGEAFIPWWEGHIAMGPDGTLYAGNDDRHLYAIEQSGVVQWKYETIDQIWSCPAIGPNGEIYFGANDFMVRSVDPAGARRWVNVTLGPIGGSVAIHDGLGLLLAGSFDGYLHAYNLDDGKQVWKFAARDHFYASPSIADDGTIYVGSTDGTLYAINPDGTLKWAFDTLDPIRSSAAIDGEGNVYVGCGDGKLYALRDDGVKLWSFDTTEGDRNDLNGSPAIGPDGLYIGGEAGTLWFVPFGYCENSGDERCDLSPDEGIPDDGAFLYHFTNGGSSQTEIERAINPTEVLTFRLVVRSGGDTVRARIDRDELKVTLTPSFAHRIEVSADGNFFSIIPENPLPMNAEYQVAIGGEYLIGGWRLGNRLVGGDKGGDFSGSFSFTTAAPTGNELPLSITDTAASVLLLRRLAVPQPPMMTTFNQIGFDSYNFLLTPVSLDPANGRFVLLAVEGTTGLDPVVNPDTK
ncbi:MAG TPA: PQQ-binding-like beta-propeller repeat protein, partial [bacterium]|nr:PQQ-binding-like beta-propeller repeat protein [bacterium]